MLRKELAASVAKEDSKAAAEAAAASEEVIYKIDIPANRYDMLCVEVRWGGGGLAGGRVCWRNVQGGWMGRGAGGRRGRVDTWVHAREEVRHALCGGLARASAAAACPPLGAGRELEGLQERLFPAEAWLESKCSQAERLFAAAAAARRKGEASYAVTGSAPEGLAEKRRWSSGQHG